MKQVLLVLQRLPRGMRTKSTTNLSHPLITQKTFITDNQSSNFESSWPWLRTFRPLSSASSTSSSVFVTENDELRAKLRRESLPKHVATIMDGNRRWCMSKGIPLTYVPFFDVCTFHAQLCADLGIPFLSTFVFCTDNWDRPKEWQELILGQFQIYLEKNLKLFMTQEIRVSVIGEISRLPTLLQEVINQVEEATKNHTRLDLIFAVSYGGRRDIVQATRSICDKIKAGSIQSHDIDEGLIKEHLWTQTRSGGPIPDPDLLIGSGWPIPLSNYMLWQMAYTELYFDDAYGPDFGEDKFIKALLSFQNRKRNYGY